MKKVLSLLAILALACGLGFAQSEQLHHADAMAVAVGHHATSTEHTGVKGTLTIVARHPNGKVFYHSTLPDLRTNDGADWQSDLMGDTSTPSVNTQCNYLGLTDTAITPAASDTTLSGEISANGLSRAQGTYAHTAGTSSYTISHTWTATGSQAAQAAGMFTASSGGTMCFENTFTAVSLATNDTITLTWTVSF